MTLPHALLCCVPVSCMCLQTLVACFNQWRSAVEYTHELEDKLAGVVLQWQNAALAAAFAAFRANTEKRRLKKRVGPSGWTSQAL